MVLNYIYAPSAQTSGFLEVGQETPDVSLLSSTPVLPKPDQKPEVEDLFSAHDFDIQIDLPSGPAGYFALQITIIKCLRLLPSFSLAVCVLYPSVNSSQSHVCCCTCTVLSWDYKITLHNPEIICAILTYTLCRTFTCGCRKGREKCSSFYNANWNCKPK